MLVRTSSSVLFLFYWFSPEDSVVFATDELNFFDWAAFLLVLL